MIFSSGTYKLVQQNGAYILKSVFEKHKIENNLVSWGFFFWVFIFDIEKSIRFHNHVYCVNSIDDKQTALRKYQPEVKIMKSKFISADFIIFKNLNYNIKSCSKLKCNNLKIQKKKEHTAPRQK